MGKRLLSLLLVLSGAASCARDEERVHLTIAGGATGLALDMTVAGVQRFMEENPNIRVSIRPVPVTTTERQALYDSFFEEESPEPDVLQIDVIWVGTAAQHALDLNEYLSQADLQRHFPSMVEANTVDGRLVAIPWYSDAPWLYYRSDLLNKYGFKEPPRSWDELEKMARTIQTGERAEGNLGFWGYVWQGRPYEGLTCNALEWQVSHGGGSFLNEDATSTMNNSDAVAAFRRAAGWIRDISPPEVLEFNEGDAWVVWQRGDAAFVRNWSYAFALARNNTFLRDRFGLAPMPVGPKGGVATLGGWQLMVSRYSRHPREAVALATFLAGEREQKRRATEASYVPTIRSLYQDEEVLEETPFLRQFERMLDHLVVRPASVAGVRYSEVSEAYWQAVHDILEGADPEDRLALTQDEISAIMAR